MTPTPNNSTLEYFLEQQAIQDNGAAIFIVVFAVIAGYAWLVFRRFRPDHPTRQIARYVTMAVGLGLVVYSTVGAGIEWGLFAFLVLLALFAFLQQQFTPILTVLMVGGVLRLSRMFDPLWYDEIITAELSALPIPHLLNTTVGDVHPPLYYLITHVFIRFLGNEEWVIRLGAYLFGLLSLYLIIRLGSRMVSVRFGVMAGVVMMCLPAHIMYSNEGRAYTMLLAFVLLAMVGNIEHRPIVFALGLAGAALSHNIGYVYAGLMGITALWLHRYHWKKWLFWCVYASLLPLLWLPQAWNQISHMNSAGWWLYPFTPAQAVLPLIEMSLIGVASQAVGTLGVIWIGCVALGLIAFRRRIPHQIMWAVVVFGVPAITIVISILWRNIYLERAMLPSVHIGVSIVVAYLLMRIYNGDRNTARVVLVPFAFVAVSMVVSNSWNVARHPIERQLKNACANVDLIYNTTIEAQFMTQHYNPGDVPLMLWEGYQSVRYQTIREDRLDVFAWERGSLEDVPDDWTVCVLDWHHPLAPEHERIYFETLRDLPAVVWAVGEQPENNPYYHMEIRVLR
jgi:uncharacterized membrane protein